MGLRAAHSPSIWNQAVYGLFRECLQNGKTDHGVPSADGSKAERVLDNSQIRRKSDKTGRARSPAAGKPGWADGLRKLYDDVVAEPLPDSFEDLLKILDKPTDG